LTGAVEGLVIGGVYFKLQAAHMKPRAAAHSG
jgi:hypothetical protein